MPLREPLVPLAARVAGGVPAALLAYYAALHAAAVRGGERALLLNAASADGVLLARLLCALRVDVSVVVGDGGAAEARVLREQLPARARVLERDELAAADGGGAAALGHARDASASGSSSSAAGDVLARLVNARGERFVAIFELRPGALPGGQAHVHVESARVVEALAAHGTWVVAHARPRELHAATSAAAQRKSARLAFVSEHAWASAASQRDRLCAALLDYQERLLLDETDERALKPLDVRCFAPDEADSAVRHARASMQHETVCIQWPQTT